MKNKKILTTIIATISVVFFVMSGFFVFDRINDGNEMINIEADAASGETSEYVEVSTFEELYQKTKECEKKIKIKADIEITGTIYISSETTIFVDSSYSLTRSVEFLGDMFVVGENEEGENPIITSNEPVKLTLRTINNAKLTIDGNSGNIDNVVKGTAFLITNTAELEMNDNVVIKDCKKLGNESTAKYRVSYPDKIGGSAVIITSGTFNMYGGEINNCVSNEDEDASSNSTHGGAIYNYGSFNMYGGKILNCKSARGGAIYNYRITKIFAGEISDNSATVYGGVVYCPNSQYTNLVIGVESSETKVYFKNNITGGSGGVIFASLSTGLVVIGGTEFEANKAENNGGAINSAGANIIKNATFKNNQSGSKGGAVYVYHNNATSTVRYTEFENVHFVENSAKSGGGAIGSGSSVSDYSYSGSNIFAKNCKFERNQSKEGGSIYIIRKCTVVLEGCEILENVATTNGGGIYVTGKSTLVLKDVVGSRNTSSKGGFLYATTGETVVKIICGEAMDNVAEVECGSTIWTNSASVVLQIKGTTTKEFFNYNGEILGKGMVAEYEE